MLIHVVILQLEIIHPYNLALIPSPTVHLYTNIKQVSVSLRYEAPGVNRTALMKPECQNKTDFAILNKGIARFNSELKSIVNTFVPELPIEQTNLPKETDADTLTSNDFDCNNKHKCQYNLIMKPDPKNEKHYQLVDHSGASMIAGGAMSV